MSWVFRCRSTTSRATLLPYLFSSLPNRQVRPGSRHAKVQPLFFHGKKKETRSLNLSRTGSSDPLGRWVRERMRRVGRGRADVWSAKLGSCCLVQCNRSTLLPRDLARQSAAECRPPRARGDRLQRCRRRRYRRASPLPQHSAHEFLRPGPPTPSVMGTRACSPLRFLRGRRMGERRMRLGRTVALARCALTHSSCC